MTIDSLNIRNVTEQDTSDIVDIYNFYIQESTASFEVKPINESELVERISKVTASNLPWLVAENKQGQVVGYAYASQWKERYSYRYSVEITVYLSPSSMKKGIATKLYNELFLLLKEKPIHSVMAGITLPNEASIALHEKFGMKQVAYYKEIGFKFDKWLDTGYWQIIL